MGKLEIQQTGAYALQLERTIFYKENEKKENKKTKMKLKAQFDYSSIQLTHFSWEWIPCNAVFRTKTVSSSKM